MLAWLEFIGEGFVAMGSLVAAGIMVAVNSGLAAVGAVVAATFALLPSMSDAPSLGDPTWLGWLNWFYPVGDLLDGFATLISMFLLFLAVRYILRLVRAL